MTEYRTEKHLDVYENRYELNQDGKTTVFYQGFQDKDAQDRYSILTRTLSNGYLDTKYDSLSDYDFSSLSETNRALLRNMVDGITSEVGRALAGLTCLQLAIKSITPAQSIRLHKGSTTQGKFSWVDGISMRSLDRNYNTPFLRRYGLLSINRDGVFMTRSLAENYPYSMLYKAEMRGPFSQWIAIVDAIENNTMEPEPGLCYLMVLLKNRSEKFRALATQACQLAYSHTSETFDEIKSILTCFFNETGYSARAFEVTMHGFYQAMNKEGLLEDADVIPISQMRSANKKHGNVGDIELAENGIIFKAWDAKYGKPYLRDELEELREKLITHPDVKVAGFVCDGNVDLRKDIKERIAEIEDETETDIYLLSFSEWIDFEAHGLNDIQKNSLAHEWLNAVVESFAQRRTDIAPIDEPCDAWLADLICILSRGEQSRKNS